VGGFLFRLWNSIDQTVAILSPAFTFVLVFMARLLSLFLSASPVPMLERVCRIGEMVENKGGEISEQSKRKLDRFVLANPMVSANLT
jgi:hypothetical protein